MKNIHQERNASNKKYLLHELRQVLDLQTVGMQFAAFLNIWSKFSDNMF